MSNHFLVVGRQFSSLKQKIIDRGDSYVLLQDEHATKYPEKQFSNRTVVDFSEMSTVISKVTSLHQHKSFTGVITTYEQYVLPTAHIAKELGLPGMPTDAATACTDKAIMRAKFALALETLSPQFLEIKSLDEAIAFAENYSYPVILKPANLAKSLLVIKCQNQEELVQGYQKIENSITAIYDKHAKQREPKLIIEEFMEGTIHSIDAYALNDGTPLVLGEVVDYQTGFDIGYDDNFHYSRLLPSKLSPNEINSIRETAKIGIKSLDMRNSPAHVEIILTKGGPRIVEIGARNGGYRERMHKLANGIDILNAWLDIVTSMTPSIIAKKNEPCAVLELFPKNPGIYTGVKNGDALEKLSSYVYFKEKAIKNTYVGKSSDGHKMCAIIILHNSDSEQFNKDLDFVNSNVYVETY